MEYVFGKCSRPEKTNFRGSSKKIGLNYNVKLNSVKQKSGSADAERTLHSTASCRFKVTATYNVKESRWGSNFNYVAYSVEIKINMTWQI